MISKDELLEKINLGENSEIEFKSAKGGLPKSIWESISAFANTKGGYIVLGVEEKNNIFKLGSVKKSSSLLKIFWDTHNNAQKLNFPICHESDVSTIKMDNNEVIVIKVPIAHRTNRPIFINNNPYMGTYKRNIDGDYRCTQIEIGQMIRDASDEPQDFGILENFTLEDIDQGTLKAYKNRFLARQSDHPYLVLDDKDFLKKLGGYKIDRLSKKEGLTLAGLLMFGKESSILEMFPHFHLDYQEKLSDNEDERWSYRITDDGTWECNIFNFYYRVYNRLVQDVAVPFALNKNGTRLGETHVHEAIREALVNTLVHANHQSTKSITIIKAKEYFIFRNPGRLRITIEQIYQGGISDVRNPYIQRMFQYLGLGEKAGSGFEKILRAWSEQQWMRPQVNEDIVLDITTVKLEYQTNKSKNSKDLEKDLEKQLNKNQIQIIKFIRENSKITQAQLSIKIGINEKNIRNNIKKLKELKLLERIGPDKGGYWELKKIFFEGVAND